MRSGKGSASAGAARWIPWVRACRGNVPVIVASDAIEGEGLWRGECLPAAQCGLCGGRADSQPAQPESISLNGLRSGKGGGTCAFAARGDFATATAEATHAKQANRRYAECVSSRRSVSGYDPAVRTSPEPGSRDDDGTVVCRISTMSERIRQKNDWNGRPKITTILSEP